MKRILTLLLMSAVLSGTLFARNYTLEQQEPVDLSGITRIEFDISGANCALCIRTIDIHSELIGSPAEGGMTLSLTGRISSNRRPAVPDIIVRKSGNTVSVRLYPDNKKFFGLSQSGRAQFTARIPLSFTGELIASGSSSSIDAASFNLENMDIRSSSGDITAREIRARNISLRVSSGDLSGTALESAGAMLIASSSGDISMGQISGAALSVKASSGDIEIDDIQAEDQVRIKVSSGDVMLGSVITQTADFSLSSGRLRIDTLDSQETRIDITSGSTAVNSARGALNLEGGSGKAVIGMESPDHPVRINVSSSSVELRLPPEAAFDARLDTKSGRIRSDFEIIGSLNDPDRNDHSIKGQVNGGGPPVHISTRSGSITLKSR